MIKNIEYSEEWLIAELIKTYNEEKNNKKTNYVKIKKTDLFKLFIKFIKLNQE